MKKIKHLFYRNDFRGFILIILLAILFVLSYIFWSAIAGRVFLGVALTICFFVTFFHFSMHSNYKDGCAYHTFFPNAHGIVREVYRLGIKTYQKSKGLPLYREIEADYENLIDFNTCRKSIVSKAFFPAEALADKEKYKEAVSRLSPDLKNHIIRYYLTQYLCADESFRDRDKLDDIVLLVKAEYGYDFYSELTFDFYQTISSFMKENEQDTNLRAEHMISELKRLLACLTSLCISEGVPVTAYHFRHFLVSLSEEGSYPSRFYNFSKEQLVLLSEQIRSSNNTENLNYFCHVNKDDAANQLTRPLDVNSCVLEDVLYYKVLRNTD